MVYRVTNDEITHVSGNEVFVFGSNLSGLHRGGAAKVAMKWGAVWGDGVGLRGNTYAIPTLNKDLARTMTVNEIKPYVNDFIDFAKGNPDLRFYVTEIGCGIAGLTIEEVAPMFKNTTKIDNIFLPAKFWRDIASNTIK